MIQICANLRGHAGVKTSHWVLCGRLRHKHLAGTVFLPAWVGYSIIRRQNLSLRCTWPFIFLSLPLLIGLFEVAYEGTGLTGPKNKGSGGGRGEGGNLGGDMKGTLLHLCIVPEHYTNVSCCLRFNPAPKPVWRSSPGWLHAAAC